MITAAPTDAGDLNSYSSITAIMSAARAGAADARRAAGTLMPSLGKAVGTGLHATGFALGFAVTLPVCFVARVMPRNNALAYGLADGGRAGLERARGAVQGADMVAAPPALAPA